MDDILMWQNKHQDQKLTLGNFKQQTIKALKEKGFRIAEDKIQFVSAFTFRQKLP